METPHRIPLHDLPLEHFLTPGIPSISRTPRKHKHAEGISLSNNVTKSPHSHPAPFMLSNMHTVTPTRPSRLGKGLIRNYGRSQGTSSPLSSHPCSPSRKLLPKPTIESSTDPQSRHYPGFDIFRDSELRRGSPIPRLTLPCDGDTLADRSEEDKENVPFRRKTKKPSSKKHLSSGVDGSDVSCLTTSVQTSKVVVHPERTPFSARQAFR